MKRIWQAFWRLAWNLSEFFKIGLGRAAPWVFGQMIGARGRCVSRWEAARTGKRWALLYVTYEPDGIDPVPYRNERGEWAWFKSKRQAWKQVMLARDQLYRRERLALELWSVGLGEIKMRDVIAEARRDHNAADTITEWAPMWGEHMLECAAHFSGYIDTEEREAQADAQR